MIYVIFEVMVNEGYMDDYLNLAAELKDSLMLNKGFVRAERFESLVNQGKLLSLSVWESEEAVREWRNQVDHRLGQKQGGDKMFKGYRITVASKVRCYSQTDREEAPEDSNKIFGL